MKRLLDAMRGQSDWFKSFPKGATTRIEPELAEDISAVLDMAVNEIERLRKERDEARRRFCEFAIQHGRVYRLVGRDTVRCETASEVAETMVWDCYKENTDG